MVDINKNQEIKIFASPDELFHAAAEDFTQRALHAVDAKGVFTVVLSGGNTPKSFFDALTENKFCQEKTPWDKIKFFFGDERYVPADDSASNYHMAYEHLFSKVPVVKKNIYPIPTDLHDPKDTAKNYEATLRKVFQIKYHEFPRFDLVYLGLGENGHTASLMPFSEVLTPPADQLVASLWVPELKMYRITLTSSAINNSLCIIFLVEGEKKVSAVYEVLEGAANPERYPAQLIHNGKTIWYLDQAAAKKL